jgi:hypothetical protein
MSELSKAVYRVVLDNDPHSDLELVDVSNELMELKAENERLRSALQDIIILANNEAHCLSYLNRAEQALEGGEG